MFSKQNFLRVAIAAVAGASLIKCSHAKKKSAFEIKKDVLYTTDLSGDLWIPTSGENHPILVMVHGGGWQRRSRKDMNPMAEFFVKQGYLVFNISYSLAPQNPFPAAVQDYLKAVDWVKTNAKTYNANSDRVFAVGYSAGAHIVSLGSVLDPKNTEHQKIADPELIKRTRVKAVSAGGTPADLTVYENSKLVIDFLSGKARAQAPELYTLASPSKQVSALSPPFFLYHGENDWIVENNQMALFKKSLEEKNIRVETHQVSWIGHVATFLYSQEPLELTDKFFRSIP